MPTSNKHSRKLHALFSDTHGGSEFGLLNPKTVFRRQHMGKLVEYTPDLTETQRYLWHIYKSDIKKTVKLAAGDDIIATHNGDLTHGNFGDEISVGSRESNQYTAGRYNLLPWFDRDEVVAMRLITGTGVHVFGEGSTEHNAAEFFIAAGKNAQVYDHAIFTISGVPFDVSHHGPGPGTREWLKGNTARYYLKSYMLEHIMRNEVPPRVVVRSHYHEPVIETVHIGGFTSTIIITASYCAPGAWTRKAMKSLYRVHNGTMVCEVEDGKLLDIHELTHVFDLRAREEI